ncbi:MAG TPA: tyrosine-type recombinase/integrase [Solirubrobacteraceae bacterium]
MPLRAICPENVQGFKRSMIDAGAGVQTQIKVLGNLSALLGKAVELQRINANPCAIVRRPKLRKERPQIPASEAVSALLAACKTDPDRLLVALMAFGGLRPQEALALTKADIGKQMISITKAMKIDGIGGTKTNAERDVPINADLAPYLEDLPDGPLFVGTRSGAQWTTHSFRNWRKRVFQPACVAVGLGVITEEDGKRSYTGLTPYHLRHHAASAMLIGGLDPLRTAAAMGHSPAVLYSIYAHPLREARGCTLGAQTPSATESAQ